MSQTHTNREKKIRSILERSSNIDAQTLQKYIDKKLTKEELHEVEKQLLNSDFATEAVEGFSNADFKVNIAASTNQLNTEIRNYNKQRGFYKRDYRVFYAAASVALVFVVLFGLFRLVNMNVSSENMAMETKVEQSENPNTKNNDLALNEETTISEEEESALVEKLKYENLEELKTKKKSNQSNSQAEDNLALNMDKEEVTKEKDFSTSDVWIRKKEKVETENNEISLTDSEKNIAASPTISANRQMNYDSSNAANTNQLADDDYNFFSDTYKKDDLRRSQKSPKEILFDAIQSYENKKYTEASLLFDSYLVTSPNNAQALYFGGMSYYENHNYKKSIPLLEKFLKQKSDIVYQKNNQDAEWYLANSYLKVNQKQKAKTVLQKIANSSSKYSNQAKSLLQK